MWALPLVILDLFYFIFVFSCFDTYSSSERKHLEIYGIYYKGMRWEYWAVDCVVVLIDIEVSCMGNSRHLSLYIHRSD